jgi:hypothetical protein
MKQKGRTPPPAPIDHASALRDRLGKAAYEAPFAHESIPVSWDELAPEHREHYRTIGHAVMREIVRRDPRQGEISVQGIVSSATHQPFVQFACDISPTQFTPAKAREIALMLLESADASESDAVLIGFARDTLGMDAQGSAQLLNQFRVYREKQHGTEVSSA